MEKTAEKTNTANTTMISTNCASHDMVVQILTEHKIAYKELGKDQKENTVLQVTYTDEQKPLVNDIQVLINFIEDVLALFMPIAIKFLKAFGEEAESALKQLQEKKKKKDSAENYSESNPLNQNTNGSDNTN